MSLHIHSSHQPTFTVPVDGRQSFSGFGSLPPELQDEIIDHIHTSPPTLRALALASRSLRPAAQFHLFSSVSLSSQASATSFLVALTQAPHLAQFVQSLALVEGRADRDGQSEWLDHVAASFEPNLLPKLHTLTLQLVVWDFLAPDTHAALAEAFPTTRALKLADCVFGEFANLRALVRALPALDTFDASFCHWREPSVLVKDNTIDAPRLSSVRLSGCPQGPIARWLLGQPDRLHSITSRDTAEDSLRGVGALCEAAGPALEHLHLSTWYHWGHERQRPEWLPEALALTTNSSLRTLRLDLPFLARDGFWLPALLSSMSSRVLQRFTLDIYLEDLAELSPVNWARLDEILGAAHHVGAFESFELLVRSRLLEVAKIRPTIMERMPRLSSRGLVHVRACRGK